MPIRVVLADDHDLVRTCVRAALSARGIEVVAECGDGRSLLRHVRERHPDIAIVDVSMPQLDGIEATRRILRMSEGTRVVLLTMHTDAHLARRARAAGARGYVCKDDPPDHLVRVLERVAAGEQCIPVGAAQDEDLLTTKEHEVLQLIAEGKRNAEIAATMRRSIHTVRSHRARLMRKLDVRTAPELVRRAQDRGLLRWPV